MLHAKITSSIPIGLVSKGPDKKRSQCTQSAHITINQTLQMMISRRQRELLCEYVGKTSNNTVVRHLLIFLVTCTAILMLQYSFQDHIRYFSDTLNGKTNLVGLKSRSEMVTNNTSHLGNQMVLSIPSLQDISLNKKSLPLDQVVLGTSKNKDYKKEFYYFFVYQTSLDTLVSKAMIESGGNWEANLNSLFRHYWLKQYNKKGAVDVVIDAGMNLGCFTLFAASQGAKVFSFEMQGDLVSLAQLSIRVSGYSHHVFVYHAAIWNETGLTLSYAPVIGNFGGTSVHHNTEGQYTVQSIRLDKVISPDPIFFLKMDIEGAEMEALQGMGKVLTGRYIHHIVFEARYNRYETIAKWLFDIGYKVCQVFDEPKENCAFPHIDRHCIFYSFSEMQEYFRLHHQEFVDGKMLHTDYVDIHCSLDSTDSLNRH